MNKDELEALIRANLAKLEALNQGTSLFVETRDLILKSGYPDLYPLVEHVARITREKLDRNPKFFCPSEQ